MTDDDGAISMLSGIVLFSLSASIFQLKRIEENRLYYWLSYFCSDLQIKVIHMDSKSSDTDPETASPCSPGSSHGKTLADSDEIRLLEMQRIFGYHQDFISAPEPISRVDSSRCVENPIDVMLIFDLPSNFLSHPVLPPRRLLILERLSLSLTFFLSISVYDTCLLYNASIS